jgi:aryl-alcohol dehydrogenase-like predicted oxidoreductase
MKLALGTVQFGLLYGVANLHGRVSAITAGEIVSNAKSYGMDTIDTAMAYGESETVLGKVGVNQWKIITKLPQVPEGIEINKWVDEQIGNSLKKLGVSQLDGVLLHRPDQLSNCMGPALYRALNSQKIQGLTKKIGVSIYGIDELDPIFDQYELDLVQAPLSIVDRSLVNSGWSRRLHKAGVEVHTRSAFLQGLLLMRAEQRPKKFNRWANIWNVWDRWLERESLTPLQACLGYVNSFSEIDRIVVGVDSVSQLHQIVKATECSLKSLPEFEPIRDLRLVNPASWAPL